MPKHKIIPQRAKDQFASGATTEPRHSDLIAFEMRLHAIRYRQMAATATTAQISVPLLRLAEQYDQMAVDTAREGTPLSRLSPNPVRSGDFV